MNATRRRRSARQKLILAGAVLALIAVAVPAAAYGYLAWSTKDAPERAALDAPPRAVAGGPSTVDGEWTMVRTPSSYAGYRIRERVGPVSAPSDAVGRTTDVAGSLRIERSRLTALTVTVTMASLRSDDERRDNALESTAIETDRYPRSSFALTRPVPLGTAERGRVITVNVGGTLDLHGVQKTVELAIDARWDGATIQVAGHAEIELEDFGIEASGLAGFSLAGTGTIEFEVTFAPRGGERQRGTPNTLASRPPTKTASDDGVICSDSRPVALAGEVLVLSSGGEAIVVGGNGESTVAYSSPTGASGLWGVSWSADGTGLVGTVKADEAQPTHLALLSERGGSSRLGAVDGVFHPDVNRRGEVVFVKDAGSGNDVWIAADDGTNARRLVHTPAIDRSPRWSLDGSRVVFSALRGASNEDLMIVNRDGSQLRSLAGTRAYEYAPSFSPDGSAVVFVRDGALMQIDLDTGEAVQLTDGPSDANPALSPDGSQLAFVREGGLFVADARGENARCVQTGFTVLAGPTWKPRAITKQSVVDWLATDVVAHARANVDTQQEGRCIARIVVDSLGVDRLRDLGLDLAANAAPELSVPPMTETEGDQVYAAYDTCLHFTDRDIAVFMADGLTESEARCASNFYRRSTLPRVHFFLRNHDHVPHAGLHAKVEMLWNDAVSVLPVDPLVRVGLGPGDERHHDDIRGVGEIPCDRLDLDYLVVAEKVVANPGDRNFGSLPHDVVIDQETYCHGIPSGSTAVLVS